MLLARLTVGLGGRGGLVVKLDEVTQDVDGFQFHGFDAVWELGAVSTPIFAFFGRSGAHAGVHFLGEGGMGNKISLVHIIQGQMVDFETIVLEAVSSLLRALFTFGLLHIAPGFGVDTLFFALLQVQGDGVAVDLVLQAPEPRAGGGEAPFLGKGRLLPQRDELEVVVLGPEGLQRFAGQRGTEVVEKDRCCTDGEDPGLGARVRKAGTVP